MAQGDVGWWGLAASLLLIAVTLAISVWRRLGLEKDVVVATVRALAQLLAVGYVLTVVIDPDQLLKRRRRRTGRFSVMRLHSAPTPRTSGPAGSA